MEVVVNAAMSADGKLSSVTRGQIPISGPEDFERVDALRASVDAVLVGIGTVIADDPHLTVKDADRRSQREENDAPKQPARVVVDSKARTPPDAAVLDDEANTFVLIGEAAPATRRERLGAHAELIIAGGDRVDLSAAFDVLAAQGVERMLVEGGGEVIFSLFAAGLVDRVLTYVGPLIIGGGEAPTLADGEGFTMEAFVDLTLDGIEHLDGGVLLCWDVDVNGSPSP